MDGTVKRLSDYLETYGILTCNMNPFLPSLEDIGCGWSDATALIDSHDLFYCKVFRKRTSYLSRKAYFLLKQCRTIIPHDQSAGLIYSLLDGAPMETKHLKRLASLSPKSYSAAFNSLLENMDITAIQNNRVLNSNWSSLLYGTARFWENYVEIPETPQNARDELWNIFSKTMSEKDFNSLTK